MMMMATRMKGGIGAVALRMMAAVMIAAFAGGASCGEKEPLTPPPPPAGFKEFVGVDYGKSADEAVENARRNALQQASQYVNVSITGAMVSASQAVNSTVSGTVEQAYRQQFDQQISTAIFKGLKWGEPSKAVREDENFRVTIPLWVPMTELQKSPAEIAADFRRYATQLQAEGDWRSASVMLRKSLDLDARWETMLALAQLYRHVTVHSGASHQQAWTIVLDFIDDAQRAAPTDNSTAQEAIAVEKQRVLRDMEMMAEKHRPDPLPPFNGTGTGTDGDTFSLFRRDVLGALTALPIEAFVGFLCERGDGTKESVLTPEFAVTPGRVVGRDFDGDAIKVWLKPTQDTIAAVFVQDTTGPMIFQAPRNSRQATAIAADQAVEIPEGRLWSQILAVPNVDYDEFFIVLARPGTAAERALQRALERMRPLDSAVFGPGVFGFASDEASLFRRELALLAGPAQLLAIAKSRETSSATDAAGHPFFTDGNVTGQDGEPLGVRATRHVGTDILVLVRRFPHRRR